MNIIGSKSIILKFKGIKTKKKLENSKSKFTRFNYRGQIHLF